MSVLDNLGINPGLMLIWIIAFIVLYTVMTRFIYDPLVNMLNERRNRIAKGLEDAAAAARARENAEAEAEKILAQARAEAQKVIDEARGRGEDVAAAVEQEARQAAAKIQTDAQTEAAATRNAELGNLREQVLSISVAAASRILGENITKTRQKALVNSFIADLPEGAKGIGGSVEVLSAMPLTATEQKNIQGEIGADEVDYQVNPEILGGLIVRWPGGMVDGSVRSQLSSLSRSLN
ncbi:MAG: F0F1 ATP synthase subunit B [Chloroflexota bacterium]|nr:F0F1 ATP synthase subunit B [Chloroflexota bacterium]